MTLAYLTSLYARASDSFVRAEVAELRALGHTVHTFSIREPAQDELSSDEVRAEHDRTDYVLSHGAATLLAAAARATLRRPVAFARTAALALRLGRPGLRGRFWPFAYLVEACYLAERLEALGVEHLHDHIAEGSAAVAMLASELSGVPFSVTVHGSGEFDAPASLALDVKLEHAAFFRAISDFTRSQVLRWVPQSEWDRVHVVPCGVEPRFLASPPTPPPSEPRFVAVGRLDAGKGLTLLLEAIARLHAAQTPAELVVVGDGPPRAELERHAERLGIADSVRFMGWLDAQGVGVEIEAARALVIPSFAEGLPVVVMEALALGRPVIATDVGALGELVVAGESGWLIPAGSVASLTAAMRNAACAPVAEIDRMGRNGARRVRARHAAARTVQQLEQLFLNAAA